LYLTTFSHTRRCWCVRVRMFTKAPTHNLNAGLFVLKSKSICPQVGQSLTRSALYPGASQSSCAISHPLHLRQTMLVCKCVCPKHQRIPKVGQSLTRPALYLGGHPTSTYVSNSAPTHYTARTELRIDRLKDRPTQECVGA
jgi:hypothetical protein